MDNTVTAGKVTLCHGHINAHQTAFNSHSNFSCAGGFSTVADNTAVDSQSIFYSMLNLVISAVIQESDCRTGTAAGTVFTLRDLAPADGARARTLWDTAALQAGYRQTTANLTAWREQARLLPLEQAAREAFELGNRAIRQLLFDPWLPAPLVDEAMRQRFVAAVTRHDDIGNTVWRQYLAALRAGSALRTAPSLPRKLIQEALS